MSISKTHRIGGKAIVGEEITNRQRSECVGRNRSSKTPHVYMLVIEKEEQVCHLQR